MTRIHCFDQVLPQGITLSCRSAGSTSAPQRVMLLHGFPEAAFVWDELMAALAPQAYCVAPNLRGFERSSAPPALADYRAKHLVADIAALIDATGGPLDLLVAHDWGGGLAWNLAALSPQLMRRLVIINSPHPGTFRRELLHSAEQQAASAYMLDLVKPDAAATLAADDYAGLFAKLTRFGATDWMTPARREQYRQVWARGLEPALNYYRASPLRPPTGPGDTALQDLVLPESVLRVTVPTTVLWGEQDHALRPGLLDDLAQWVPQLTVHRHADASHWVVHEQHDWVLAHLQALLQGLPQASPQAPH